MLISAMLIKKTCIIIAFYNAKWTRLLTNFIAVNFIYWAFQRSGMPILNLKLFQASQTNSSKIKQEYRTNFWEKYRKIQGQNLPNIQKKWCKYRKFSVTFRLSSIFCCFTSHDLTGPANITFFVSFPDYLGNLRFIFPENVWIGGPK